jgi:hypothetical protein
MQKKMENIGIEKGLSAYLKQYDNKIISLDEWYDIYDNVKHRFSVSMECNRDVVILSRFDNDVKWYNDVKYKKFEGSEVYKIIVTDIGNAKNKYARTNEQAKGIVKIDAVVSENKERVNHPSHYQHGNDNTYEAIKVINAWGLNFELGNTVKYISRAGKKDPSKEIEDFEKALWYLNHHIDNLKKIKNG